MTSDTNADPPNDNVEEPLAVRNVSTRGVSFAEMGWSKMMILNQKVQVERATGLSFSDDEWLSAESPGAQDLLISTKRRLKRELRLI